MQGLQQVQSSQKDQRSRYLLHVAQQAARCNAAMINVATGEGLTLPAPEPPISAVSCPGTALPLMVLSSSRRAFFPLSSFLCFPGSGTKYCRLRYTCGRSNPHTVISWLKGSERSAGVHQSTLRNCIITAEMHRVLY